MGYGLSVGVGVIMQFLEVMWNIEQNSLVSRGSRGSVHSLETNRARPISRQILVLSEHNLFTLKGT